MKNKWMIALFVFLSLSFVKPVFATEWADESDYGLKIKSSPVSESLKTSLILENNSPYKLAGKTTLSFQMYIREDYMFGLIFRMVTNRNENIDLMLTISDTERYVILVIDEIAHIVPQVVLPGQWFPLSITLSKPENRIVVKCADKTLTVAYPLDRTSDFRISFGTCPFKSFESTDIASINIRDVKIFNDGRLKRYWKLKEHQQDFVLDSVAQVAARALNPDWLVDARSTWEKVYSNKFPMNTQIVFNPAGTFYVVSPDSRSIRALNMDDGSEQTIRVNRGYIVSTSPNTIFFDGSTSQLVSYNIRDASLSRYSFDANEWSADAPSKTDPFLNNSVVYNPADHSLYSFGGYEYYRYNHSLIKMSAWDGSQKQSEVIEIQPRFSVSSAVVGSRMYVFGGRGSKTGKQEIAPHNYYDLYSIDLITRQAVKLWELDSVENDFLPGENMLFDSENQCFYVFATLNGGCLLKIERDEKGYEPASYPIGEQIDALYLYTNLYYAAERQKLYALIYQQKNHSETEVSIYSLDYPPVPIRDLSQTVLYKKASRDFFPPEILWSAGAIILCALTCGIVYYCITRRKKKVKPNGEEVVEKSKKEAVGMKYYDFSKSSICFLESFTVIDKEGNDITGQFSPTLKNLLILLVLHSEKDEKGIFGNKMLQILWPDRNKESAKNIQYVYLSKLRSTLEKVGDVEVLNRNGFWAIHLGDNIRCDYTEAMRLFGSLKRNSSNYQEQIDPLLELLLLGVLLPNIEIDWLDNFKNDFSNLTIEILTQLANEKKHQLSDELLLKIADTLFLHDFVNEDALYTKCSLFFRQGKMGIAKNVYVNFCKEYKNLLGVKYKYSLTDVLANH